jgi:ubiquinone biosynthesis protein
MLKPAFSPGRFKEIIAVFIKYGFEDVLGYMKLPGKRVSHKLMHVPDGLTPYVRIRMAFEELGPTFVKFGQIMSLRSDLLPRPLIGELERLQDKAAPVDKQSILEVLEENLPRAVDDIFTHIDDNPIASASLSQVHRAVLRSDGRIVAVKVQRPGIQSDIIRDLDIFAYIARRLHERAESMKVYNLPSLVDLLRRTLDQEINFLREARHMHIAREHMKELPGILIPSVLYQISSEKVLVMENIEGTRPGRLIQEQTAHLASIGLAAAVKQILEVGFFHADMHPGNMLIVDPETLCLLDWGMVGRLTPQDRNDMIELIGAVVDHDSDRLVDAILSINATSVSLDRRRLQIDVMELLDMHTVAAVEEIKLGMLLLDITDLLRKHDLHLPVDMYMMMKALVTAEGTARLMHPQLDIIAELKPHLKRLTVSRFKPHELWHRIRAMAFKLVLSPARFPRQISEIVEKMQRGELRVRFEHHNLYELRHTLEKTFSRLTLGIISAAMIIASSLILINEVPPMMAGYSMLGTAGYLIAGMISLWVVYDILRNL